MKIHTLPRFISLIICFLTFWAVAAIGESAYVSGKPQKTLLVISSYYEGEPWANDITEPIANYISGIKDVTCDIVNLNCSTIPDSAAYNDMEENLFSAYATKHPDYIVMVGTFAFSLRDRIREEWGDKPTLLITFFDTFGTLEEQYTGNDKLMNVDSATPLEDVHNDYNFTAIIVPNYCHETVDLMLRMIPDMNEFVYFSTNMYAARYTAAVIKNKLERERPEIEFKWVKASEENSEVLREYIGERKPQTGLLLSSWVYTKTSVRGNPLLTSNELRLISSSKNPIFSLREPYRIYGSIGGVYENTDEVHNSVRSVVDLMMDSLDLRNVPFIYTKEKDTYINYRLMVEYGLKEANCPKGTKFYVKPLSFWEMYKWQAIVVGLIFIIVLCFFWWKVSSQYHRIKRLNYSKMFISNMPVPFAKADIMFNKYNEVININYTTRNAAFDMLIEQNAIPGNPFLLFPAKFISDKTSQLLSKKQNVVFTYFFENTNTYYEFTLCSVMEKNERYGSLKVVDIFVTDLTNRYWMERRLRHFAKKLDLALTAARMVAWQWDFKRGIITYDDRGLFDRTKSYRVTNNEFDEWEIKEEDFLLRLHPEDRQKQIDSCEALKIGSANSYNIQLRILSKDNTSFEWVDTYGTVTERDEQGRPTIATGALTITTEKVNANRMLLEALDKAKETDRLKSSFIANMSHEIRTPLNAIVGFSNLLADDITEEERTEFKNIINLNNDLLLSLINDILDLAKIESNTIEVNITTADINAIMQTAEQTVQFRLQPGVQLNVHYGMKSCHISADPIRVTQVLTNFLTNACKFTPEGHIDLGYELSSDGKMLYFYVQDTGIGISEEYKQAVFEQFVKLNDFAQGTGLGLAICSRLVALMGGEIGVESEGKGKGSRFWFTIPYAPIKGEDNSETDGETGSSADKQSIVRNSDKPLILVAEDNDSNYKLVAHILKDDYTIVRAFNGAEAIEMCKKNNPQLILMDISMPVMDGYEATRNIRTFAPDVPIVAVTAYAYESDRQRILSSGFNGYVAKPISSINIKEALKRAMGGGGE